MSGNEDVQHDPTTWAQFDMRSPTHRPDIVPAEEHAPGQSTAAQLARSRQLYRGRLTPEQRDLHDQVRAERRVAKVLERLTRVGARLLHDRRLPYSAAQLDHLIVSPAGVHLISTIAAGRRRPVRWVGSDPVVGDVPVALTADFTYRAAAQIAQTVSRELGTGWQVVVYPVVVIVGANVVPTLIGGTEISDLPQLPTRMTYRPGVLNPVEVALLADATARACPPAPA